MAQIQRFKIVLIGDKESGKTTFVNMLKNGTMTQTYVPTLGVDVHPIPFRVIGK